VIAWVTGLPGIGKSSHLSSSSALDCSTFRVDSYRNQLMHEAPLRSKIFQQAALSDTQWPLSERSFWELHRSISGYLAFQVELGRQLAAFMAPVLEAMRTQGRWIGEVSPFVLPALRRRNEACVYTVLGREEHANRLSRRLSCDIRTCAGLSDFYAGAVGAAPLSDVSVLPLEDFDARTLWRLVACDI